MYETRRDGKQGYEFAVLGAHDADIDELIARVLAKDPEEIRCCHLHRDHHLGGWRLAGTSEVAGRLSYDPDGGPPPVVVKRVGAVGRRP